MDRHLHVSPEVAASPWRTMAADAAREWWRDNPGAPLDEYDEWAYAELEPQMLRGMGWRPGMDLTLVQVESLYAVRDGLVDGVAMRRRRAA
jgi:hypothetical protein